MRDDEGRSRRFARKLRRKMTDPEVILWSRFQHWPVPDVRFRRQHPIGIYVADFACIAADLVIEVDGATHSTEEERAYDAARERYIKARDWRIMRVQNADIYDRLDDVLDQIARELSKS